MQFTIKKSLVLIALVVVFSTAGQGIAQFILKTITASSQAAVMSMHKNADIMRDAYLDHLAWRNDLLTSFENGVPFKGSVDPAESSYRKWRQGSGPGTEALPAEQEKIARDLDAAYAEYYQLAARLAGSKGGNRKQPQFMPRLQSVAGAIDASYRLFFSRNELDSAALEKRLTGTRRVLDWIMIPFFVLFVGVILVFILRLERRIGKSIAAMKQNLLALTRGDLAAPGGFKKVKCSELRNCGRNECAMYDRLNCSCFIEVGSYAPNVGRAVVCPSIKGGKFKDCNECPVMRELVPDEMTEMAIYLEVFREKLKDVVESIRDMVSTLRAASGEMSAATMGFSDNAQNQAASAEEITATVEEVAAAVENIARNARTQFDSITSLIGNIQELSGVITEMSGKVKDTLQRSALITEQARSGEDALKKMNNSMGVINQSSGEMKNIVKMINEISEHINLLSLNAAIEAARAGDSGRGFAVVADEVSKLADQTASSIKSIDGLIQGNNKEIEQGMATVNTTVEAISGIIEGVAMISRMMDDMSVYMQRQIDSNRAVTGEADGVKIKSDEIKIATEEQKLAFEEIVKSVSKINELTQQNAVGAEQMAVNTENISGIADSVMGEIAHFKSGDPVKNDA